MALYTNNATHEVVDAVQLTTLIEGQEWGGELSGSWRVTGTGGSNAIAEIPNAAFLAAYTLVGMDDAPGHEIEIDS